MDKQYLCRSLAMVQTTHLQACLAPVEVLPMALEALAECLEV